MSQFVNAARCVAAASLVGGFACLGPAIATADPNSDALAGMLSKGYSTSNCKTATASGALAEYTCGQNADSSGPGSAAYFLYANAGDTSEGFTGGMNALALASCGDQASPGTWHYKATPGTPAGQVACGTEKASGASEVVWTNDKNHMVGIVGSKSSIASLYQWWLSNG